MKKANNSLGKEKSPEPQPPQEKQILPEGAEKYLRESANIEDLPDPEELDKVEELSKQTKKSNGEKQ
jgi:hypothetical protein